MKILALDTSSLAASAALWEEGRLLGEFYVDVRLTHSQTILPMVDALLSAARVSRQELGLLATSVGPGSFTGLRIGLAAVKGIADALSLPCVGISTLEGLAGNLVGQEGICCAVMDARCAQVYTACFALRDGRVERLDEDRAIPLAQLQQELFALSQQKNCQNPIILVGDGAQMCYNQCSGALPLQLAEPRLRLQRASSIAMAAERRWQEGQAVSSDALRPVYLRLSQAERERAARLAAQSGAGQV